DGDEDMGSVEEGGQLPARPEARGPVRRLQVHVSSLGPGRVQAGSGIDPGLRHLRRVRPSPPWTGPGPRFLTSAVEERLRPPPPGPLSAAPKEQKWSSANLSPIEGELLLPSGRPLGD